MAEEIVEKKKPGLGLRLLKRCLKSPVNTLFILAIVYFAIKMYFFDPSFSAKLMLVGTTALWVFWFIAKQVFILLIVLVLLGSGAYMYYDYSRQDAIKCEEAGGYWNSNTRVCEAKRSLWEKVQQVFSSEKKEEPQKSETSQSDEVTE